MKIKRFAMIKRVFMGCRSRTLGGRTPPQEFLSALGGSGPPPKSFFRSWGGQDPPPQEFWCL